MIAVGSHTPFQFQFREGAFTSNPNFTGIAAGTYYVTVKVPTFISLASIKYSNLYRTPLVVFIQ